VRRCAGKSDFCAAAAVLRAAAGEPLLLKPEHRRWPATGDTPDPSAHAAPAAAASSAAAGGGVQGAAAGAGESRVQEMMRMTEEVSLGPVALALAMQIDGSAGGGFDRAVLWNEFDSTMRKLDDGKLYFVIKARGDGATAGDNSRTNLWDYAMQDYGMHAATVHGAASSAG
jgi:hypothetical protein